MKTVQLRRYRIREGEYDAFIAWWSSAMPELRAATGFRIEFAYGIPETSEFIWAVSVEGPPDRFADVEARYLASKERAAVMSANTERTEVRTVQLVSIIPGATP